MSTINPDSYALAALGEEVNRLREFYRAVKALTERPATTDRDFSRLVLELIDATDATPEQAR